MKTRNEKAAFVGPAANGRIKQSPESAKATLACPCKVCQHGASSMIPSCIGKRGMPHLQHRVSRRLCGYIGVPTDSAPGPVPRRGESGMLIARAGFRELSLPHHSLKNGITPLIRLRTRAEQHVIPSPNSTPLSRVPCLSAYFPPRCLPMLPGRLPVSNEKKSGTRSVFMC